MDKQIESQPKSDYLHWLAIAKQVNAGAFKHSNLDTLRSIEIGIRSFQHIHLMKRAMKRIEKLKQEIRQRKNPVSMSIQ